MKRLFAIAWLLSSGAAALAGTTSPFTVAPVNFSGTPSSIALGSDGNVWMTDNKTNTVGKLTPGGTYTTFPIPTAKALAYNATLGPDGNVWFAEFGTGKIGRVTPDGVVTEFALAAGYNIDSLAAGSDGNMWFTEDKSSNGPPVYSLGSISAADASFKTLALPTNGRATGLVAGLDGSLWIGWVESSSKYDVLRVTPTGTVTTFALPAASQQNALGATMLLGPDANVWFFYGNNLARVKPDGIVTLYAVPTANANMLPAGLTIGPDGNIWFTEFSAGKIGQLLVDSATDSGQATINESDAFGGLPQTILVLSTAAPAPSAPTALANCPNGGFWVQSQLTSQSPANLMTATTPPPSTCADVQIDDLFMHKDSIVVQVLNAGKDDASNVTMRIDVSAFDGLVVDGDATTSADGACNPTVNGITRWTIKCSWPVVGARGFRMVTIVLKDGAHGRLPLRAIAVSGTPDPKPLNNTASWTLQFGVRYAAPLTPDLGAINPIPVQRH